MIIGEHYTHLESGKVYVVIAIGLMKLANEARLNAISNIELLYEKQGEK